MTSFFRLSGTYTSDPSVGAPSADPGIAAPIDERLTLALDHADKITLTADPAVPVSFGGLTNAHVVVIKVPGEKVIARFTSADGATQAIPVSELAILISQDTPFTAIDVQRVAGVTTTVKVFLGEKA